MSQKDLPAHIVKQDILKAALKMAHEHLLKIGLDNPGVYYVESTTTLEELTELKDATNEVLSYIEEIADLLDNWSLRVV